jgi:DNA-binding transcriptional regulator YiaG
MSKLGDELVQPMAQALAHAQGKRTRSRTHKVTAKPDDIRKARKRLGLSQDQLLTPLASALRRCGSGSRVNVPLRAPPRPC